MIKKIDCFTGHHNLEKCINKTNSEYRLFDPGLYLYNLLCNTSQDEKYKSEYIKLVYTTLVAWGMNSRGAKLSKYDVFEASILDNQSVFERLSINKIEKCTIESIKSDLKILFKNLNLVRKGNPKLVTFTKTVHFFLTDLIVPMDRTYTIPFFHTSWRSEYIKQFDLLCKMENLFMDFAANNYENINKFKDEKWNRNIPKIIDSLVIGYEYFEKANKKRHKKKNA